jgi:rare lipoprotein A
MKRAWPLYTPSLTGCMLVASLCFGCLDVSGALARPVADGPPLATAGTKPLPPSRVQIGMASWYGRRWQGRPTASGERYDRHQPTAAHRTAPLGTQAVVTNLANGHVVRVRITDRGPHTRHRILDLSYEAARRLDMVRTGAARVKVEFLAAPPPLA